MNLIQARGATGELRQRRAVVLPHHRLIEAGNQLRAFLKNGEVGGKGGVEHLVEAATPQRGVHFERHGRPGRAAEAFADGGAGRGGGLNDDQLVGILDGAPDRRRVVALGQRACRAAVDALAAIDAPRVHHFPVHEGADAAVVAATFHGQRVDALIKGAGLDAAAAGDAFVHVADDDVLAFVPRCCGARGLPKRSLCTWYSAHSACNSQEPLRPQEGQSP